MSGPSGPVDSVRVDGMPSTAKGRATQERIVAAACELIGERGVAAASLDAVIARAGVSKSQLYHYFDDRAALLRAVVVHNADGLIEGIGPVDGWDAIRSWFDAMLDGQVERGGCGGCPLGSLVAQLAETDDETRAVLAASLARWEAQLGEGLRAMQHRGELARGADPGALATATIAAIEGGLLLTQATRDPGRLAVALDAAFAHLRAP
jgi:TetR/AcrR family transcriptional regulator, transcriptional repressor for nem operon